MAADVTCEKLRELGAELALGVLPGRERAGAVAHLEQCADCREHVEQLTQTGDRLIGLLPCSEPPVGFETRVAQALTRLAATANGARAQDVRAQDVRAPDVCAADVQGRDAQAREAQGQETGGHQAGTRGGRGRTGLIRRRRARAGTGGALAPETRGPETYGPEVHGPETHGPEVHGPETHGPEVHGPETHGPEVHGGEGPGREGRPQGRGPGAQPVRSGALAYAGGAARTGPLARVRPWTAGLAAALALAVGFGGWAVGTAIEDTVTVRPAQSAGQGPGMMWGGLTSARAAVGRPAGEVYAHPGTPGWVYMSVELPRAGPAYSGKAACQLVRKDGSVIRVGTFTLHEGQGSWGAPAAVDPATLAGARLTAPDGTVLATARFAAGAEA
ncbi:hypothetical protein [Streptomyces sp. NPDC004065]|uniref:hypothetical protein n=1 Tax=Streptomyces sp. NPDC004065 TaxID=3364689 RepID=UPI00384B88FD